MQVITQQQFTINKDISSISVALFCKKKIAYFKANRWVAFCSFIASYLLEFKNHIELLEPKIFRYLDVIFKMKKTNQNFFILIKSTFKIFEFYDCVSLLLKNLYQNEFN